MSATPARLRLPYFDGAEVDLWDDDAPLGGAEALGRFLRLGPEDRARDARHVLAYWIDFRELDGSEGFDEEVGAVPGRPDDVWRHVSPRSLAFHEWRGSPVVSLEANCRWEPEHGLNMVWLDGWRLIKVGPWDGHDDNMIWERGPDFEAVVYEAQLPQYMTWRDDA